VAQAEKRHRETYGNSSDEKVKELLDNIKNRPSFHDSDAVMKVSDEGFIKFAEKKLKSKPKPKPKPVEKEAEYKHKGMITTDPMYKKFRKYSDAKLEDIEKKGSSKEKWFAKEILDTRKKMVADGWDHPHPDGFTKK
tara:strand:- start:929 stop:1339 length:411 start_codon:yes stop_codon:yes gene_type:complete